MTQNWKNKNIGKMKKYDLFRSSDLKKKKKGKKKKKKFF